MKGGNTDSKAGEVQGFDYNNVEKYGTVDMTGGKKGKRSQKFSEFDFEKEWKEFETSYNQKYGGASKKKKPAKKTSSTKKKPAKKGAKKPTKRKTQKGGDEAGATFAPAQFFDANASMSAPSNGPFQSAYGTISNNNLAPYPNATETQTGGAKKKGSKAKKAKPATKTTKPKKDTKKKDSKKDTKKDSKKDTKSTGKKTSVLDKIKKFFAM
jgi:hypothetical protein